MNLIYSFSGISEGFRFLNSEPNSPPSVEVDSPRRSSSPGQSVAYHLSIACFHFLDNCYTLCFFLCVRRSHLPAPTGSFAPFSSPIFENHGSRGDTRVYLSLSAFFLTFERCKLTISRSSFFLPLTLSQSIPVMQKFPLISHS